MAHVMRIVKIARTAIKIGLANLACNMRRAAWLAQQQVLPARQRATQEASQPKTAAPQKTTAI